MAYDFPNSPTPGQVYAPGPTYVYSHGAWVVADAVDVALTGAQVFNSYAQAQASVIPGDLEAVQLLGYVTPGDGGGALYKRVLVEPAHLGKFQSADGAWWELAENEVTLEMFGGKADGTFTSTTNSGTDNLAAMNAALHYAETFFAEWVYGVTATIRLLRGRYRMSGTIKINHQVKIVGSAGYGSGNSTTSSALLFPIDTLGIYLFGFQSPDPDTGIDDGRDSSGTILENFLMRAATFASDKTKHGIFMRSQSKVVGVRIENFSGNGVNIEAVADDPGATGNANLFRLERVRVMFCEHGFYFDGPDVNAGTVIDCDATANRAWGFFDGSFLGNTFISCHTDQNAMNGQVHYAGNRYDCQNAALGGTTTPGTDATVWRLQGAGGVHLQYPEWIPGHVYVVGGTYYAEGGNQCSVFIGCYTEGAQPPARINSPSIKLSGNSTVGLGNGLDFGVRGTVSAFVTGQKYTPGVGNSGVVVHLSDTPDDGVVAIHTDDHALGLAMSRWDAANKNYIVQWANSAIPIRYTGQGNVLTGGRASPLPGGEVMLPRGVFLGNSDANCRLVQTGAAPPASGPHAQGEIMFNISAAASGKIGWVCTAAGTPGTWKAFGAIDP